MNNYMQHIRVCIVWTLIVLLTGCILRDDPAKERAARALKAEGEILMGAVAPWSDMDNLFWEGMALAVDEINEKGGLLGRKIRVIKRDDESSVKKGIAISQTLGENPDVVAVLGHYQSFVTMPASVVYQYYGILLLSTVDRDPRLTEQGFSLVFRTTPDDMAYGKKLADFCRRKGLDELLVFIERSEYGRDFSDAFFTVAQSAENAGLRILDSHSYNSGTGPAEFQEKLTFWKTHYSFDAIIISGALPQAATIIKEIRGLGIDKPIIGGISLDRNKLLDLLGGNVKDVYFPTDFNPGSKAPEVRKFIQAFRSRHGKDPDVMAAHGYDGIQCLAYAVRTAGSTAPPAMASALRKAANLTGVTGTMSFSQSGERIIDKIFVKMVENGTFHYLD